MGDNRSDNREPASVSTPEIERYSRQLLLPTFGLPAQSRLHSSRVLIIGLGGLGSPASLYLSGAGIGTLGLVDRPNDVVEKSNLHRQPLHTEQRVGMNKLQSAVVAIQALNSSVQLETHAQLTCHNAVSLISRYDVVLDCTDNVQSRYLINDACAASNTPLIQGAAIGMEGQLSVYCAQRDAPCYRCIFPKPPPPNCVGSCDSAGVLGPVPGTIGTLQALEAIKMVGEMGKCESLSGRLLLFDATSCQFRNIKLRGRNDQCVACGSGKRIDVASFDYDSFANGPSVEDEDPVDEGMRIDVHEFAKMRKRYSPRYRLIDVRPRAEFDLCHLPDAESHPLSTLHRTLFELNDLNKEIRRLVFICRRGNSSRKALRMALDAGCTNCTDVVGGLESWHFNIDKYFPLY